MTAPVINAFTTASLDLLRCALAELKSVDAAAYQGISRAAASGSFFEVTCALSPTGLLEQRVMLVTPSGESINLARAEWESHQKH